MATRLGEAPSSATVEPLYRYDLPIEEDPIREVLDRRVPWIIHDETFSQWLDRAGGAKQVGTLVADLDNFPDPDEHPEFYIDFDETGPYEAAVGDSECAT